MKLNIDTLLISGGGMNCISHLGSLNYLFEIGGINEDLNCINNIIGVSGAIISLIPLILGYTSNFTIKLLYELDITNYLSEIKLKNILKGDGLYSQDFIITFIKKLLSNKGINTEINLKELYHKTNKNLLFKVVNITKGKVEYINHENNPNIKLYTCVCITSSAPFVFPPVKYNNMLYCDGGVCGSFPYEKTSEKRYMNYIGFSISGSTIDNNIENNNVKIKDIFHYLSLVYDIYGYHINKTKSEKIRIICTYISGSGLLFDTADEKTKLFLEGYNSAKDHFEKIIDYKHNHSE